MQSPVRDVTPRPASEDGEEAITRSLCLPYPLPPRVKSMYSGPTSVRCSRRRGVTLGGKECNRHSLPRMTKFGNFRTALVFFVISLLSSFPLWASLRRAPHAGHGRLHRSFPSIYSAARMSPCVGNKQIRLGKEKSMHARRYAKTIRQAWVSCPCFPRHCPSSRKRQSSH